MALTRTSSPRSRLGVAVVAAAFLSVSFQALAEDLRIQKAKDFRDQILAKRAAAAKVERGRPGQKPEVEPDEDPAVEAARARLADVEARLEQSRQRSEGLAAPREKLSVRSDELTAEVAKVGEANRARVDSIYRSAKLGAGAAGWHHEQARSARLSRYLAAVSAAQQERLARLEVEQGSVVAALDRARAEDAALAAERRVLEADRVEAQAGVDRVLEVSTGGPPPTDGVDGDLGADGDVAPEEFEPGSPEDVELRMAEAAAKIAAASAARSGPAPVPPAAGDFQWPGSEPVAAAPAAPAATNAEAVAPAAAPIPDEESPPELEDGPAVLAPSEEPAAPAPGDGAASARAPGLLSRLFDNGDSDRFASARGTLPVPVAGKVVANYGQQHKSGGTYRGVILRATHGAPVRTVAPGRVSFVGIVPGLGSTVIVSHGSRFHTVYARLGSAGVREGEDVAAGTRVGELPDNDSDMHFELRDQGKAVDPVPWLKPGVPGAAP